MADKLTKVQSGQLRVLTDDGVMLAVHHSGPQTAQHTVVFLHGFCPQPRVLGAPNRRFAKAIRVFGAGDQL